MARSTIAEIDAAVRGQTFPRQFLATVAAHGSVVALRHMAGESDWEELTYADYGLRVAELAAGLAHLGVGAGDRVLLMMRNRPEFHLLDTAAQFLRAVPFSVYNSSSPTEILHQAGHAAAVVAIVEDGGFLSRLLAVRDELPELRTILCVERPHGAPGDIGSLADLQGHGDAVLPALAAATKPEDLATLIYTSGTTGPPKGVMISQYNVTYTGEQLSQLLGIEPAERVGMRLVSYLPMAHIAERMNSHYQAAANAFTVTTCPEVTAIATYAKEVRPHIIFGVPRVWEKIYAGVNGTLALDPEKKASFDDGVAAALPIKEAMRMGVATQEQRDTYAFLDAVAFSVVRGLVGLDEVRLAITGAAPLPKEVLEWFNAIGVPLSEIYGLSETTGPMTWEPYAIKPGTVGPAIPGCEVRLADDGEVHCRGGNVFQSYYNDPVQTAAVLVDGWFCSGDIGEVDEDGYLRIVDRKKELIITAGGKNLSPANLEAALKSIPLVGQAAAIGDRRRFVSALLVLDPELAPIWATQQGLNGDLAALAADATVLAEVQRGVDEINARLAQVEQIRRFVLIGEEWLADSDVLTPTSKLKRRGVEARYATEIEGMYA